MGDMATLAKPELVAPQGACDTHMHFFGPAERFPPGPAAPIRMRPFMPGDYRILQRRLGLQRVVVVQSVLYGTNNACALEGAAEFGDQARVVAIVAPDVSEAELVRLDGLGVRGVRFMLYPGVPLAWDDLLPLASRIAPLGWQLHFQHDGRQLLDWEPILRRVPGPLVIDHIGRFMEPVAADHPAFRALLRLLDCGRVWVKLSSPYDMSRTGPPGYADIGALAQALVQAAPDRMLWASNAPHTNAQASPPDDAQLLDTLLNWAPDEAVRRKILVDNPARLFGFGT